MSKVDFSTVAGIRAEIGSIAKAGKTLDGRIQRCAVAAFEHMLAHRDHTLLGELYQALNRIDQRVLELNPTLKEQS